MARWTGLLAVVCMTGLSSGPAVAVTFAAHYTDVQGQGFYDAVMGSQRREAFEFALQLWQSRIPATESATIDVFASFDALGGTSTSAVLGSGGPSSFTTGFSGSNANTAYPNALANYLAGSNLNGSKPDIEITFNGDIDGTALGLRKWYYGLDMAGPQGDPDFVTVALHELTHSMGFISTFQASGVYGLDLGTYGTVPDVFDRYLVNSTGSKLLSLAPVPWNVTHPVFWGGTQGIREYNLHDWHGRPVMYAPSTFSNDSSLSHLDESTFVDDFDLMTPYLSNVVHTPDDVVRGIMADIGWHTAGTGDADLSGRVDVLDLLAIANRLGESYGQTGYLATADANGDGTVDMKDLILAGHLFGQQGMVGQAPGHSSFLASGGPTTWTTGAYRTTIVATVPEPVTWLVLAAGLGLMVVCRRRRG